MPIPLSFRIFSCRRHWAGQHNGRVGADLGRRTDARAGFQTHWLHRSPSSRSATAADAIDDATGVARVMDVIDLFQVRVLQQVPRRRKPGITSPWSLKAGFNPPSACMSVPGRMYSSRDLEWAGRSDRMIGTMDFSNRLSFQAAAARFWLSTAKASASSRLKTRIRWR